MRRWPRILLAVAALVLLLSAAAALVGPGLLRDRAKAWVKAETGRTLEVGKVSVNLLTLGVEIRDLTLTEPDQSTPFVRWERLHVALSPRSLWHRAPVVRELTLEKPAVRIERLPAGRFNFSDLLEPRPAEPAKPAKTNEPTLFSLNNLVVHGGHIEIIDRTLATPATHRVEALELAVPFIGNLPYLADRYVQPLLRATVNGAPLELKGELKPFADAQEYSLKLALDGIDLPRYLDYLPMELPVRVHGGKLDLDLDLTYHASAAAKPLLTLSGRCDLTTFDLRERSGRPLLFLPLLEVRLAPSKPLDRHLHLASVSIDNLQSWLDRNPVGVWNVTRLGGDAAPTGVDPGKEEKTSPLQLRIDRLRLKNGRLEVRDQFPARGFITTLKGIRFDLDGFTLAEGPPFKLALELSSERQERLAVNGQLAMQPFALDLTVDAKEVPLAAYQPYYQTQVAAAIGGTLDLRSRVLVSPEQPLLLKEAALDVHHLELPLSNGEGFKLTHAALQGGSFDLAANRFEAAELSFDGVSARFSRNQEGRWSFLDRNYPLLAKLAEPAATAPTEPVPAETRAFSWRIGQIALHDAQIAFRDDLPNEPARFDITGLGMTVRNLAAPEKVPGSFELQGSFQKKGQFQASGTAILAGPELNTSVRLRRIPLASFAPYLGEKVRLVLIDGTLDTRLSASVTKGDRGWQGRIDGDLGIGRFYCLDADHREDLLRWERLQFNGIDARLDPPALKIASVALNDYYARVLLDEQSRLNLAELFVKPPAGGGDAAPVAVPAATDPPAVSQAAAAPPPKPEIRIGKITLQGGKVNFTDRHLPRPFTAEMLQLGGRIEGLSSVPGSRAEIDLRGRLRNESPLTIVGTLNPLADPLFLDLKLDFTDIELSPLSPYSGTYVGYLIERGKLNVALTYLVENGRLKASNRIFLDQFTFGDPVESDKATSLPVRLAVALLKDRKGEIHLDIPVSGNLDDPQFSVWGVVWQIIKNLLVKAVTSPLALLGALGGGGEEFSAIVFPAGSMRLTDAEQAKLARIAAALRDRPELKLEVKGYVDPEQDPESYRQEVLQERLRREKLIDLRKGQGDAAPATADAVTVTAAEYPDYLWRVYKVADFPKPRNLIGLVKHLPDAELEKLLLANTRIGSEELTALAQGRAQAVAAALIEPGGIPRERVFLVTTEITAMPATAGISRSRVEFGVAVK